jgi:hypothetical protein
MDSPNQWLIKTPNSAVEGTHCKQRAAHFSRWAVPHSVHITQTKSMDIDEIIRKWYTLASGGDIEKGDVFFRFVAVWVAFNALYASRFYEVTGDKEQVHCFARERRAIERHQQLVHDDPEYLQAVRVLKQRGIYDTRTRQRTYISRESDLFGVALCLYQVRDNLFHSGEMPDNLRDETVVNASYIILSKLIQPYLRKTSS